MAATAAQPVLGRSASSRAYQSPPDSRHRRTASGSASATRASSDFHRSHDQTNTSYHTRSPASQSQQQPMPAGGRRDHEPPSLPQPAAAAASAATTRRSSSRDQSNVPPSPSQRRDAPPSSHYRNESRSSRNRYSTEVPRGPPPPSSHSNMSSSQRSHNDGVGLQRPQGRRSLEMPETGSWELLKTIGAGSMGKVKLARNRVTGEHCALKIVPRQSTEEYRSQRERERADHSKDVRTAREAAIVKLLKHPYICGLRDVLRTNNHWYMLFEYVNGGQMLDYIISHGRLKEKHARKFARQIASALDYCHKNSIVHRDLKIENILISKTGDIKIIDFGLSNLYAPGSLLKTFCGSLYFAAPELLQAQPYDGPEVDVWSFGIVLYVLVCGKVPFDDQSMPQLHAKIKKGQADYPNWLSAECKHLISRMLTTDSKQRATLSEIMNHSWMLKGYNGPLENYLPQREPLKLPLDDEVIEHMTGFEFGSADQIKERIVSTLESEKYQVAARLSKTAQEIAPTPGSERRRGVFDFYKRRNSTTSRDSVNVSTEQLSTLDPLNAFGKELSIYYLAKEKLQREMMPQSSHSNTLPTPSAEPIATPQLEAPKAAYTNASTYEQPGERPTGGRSRPRARTHGEDEVTEGLAKMNVAPSTPPPQVTQAPRRETLGGGLLRRFSTRKRGGDAAPEKLNLATDTSSPTLKPPGEAAIPRRGFSMRKTRMRDSSASPDMRSPQAEHLALPSSANPVARAGQKILGRSSSVNSGDWRRRKYAKENEAPEPQAPLTSASNVEPPLTSGSEHSTVPRVQISEPTASTTVDGSTSTPPRANVMQRSATSAKTKSLGHARRESMQARRAKRNESLQKVGEDVPEETEKELQAAETAESQSEMKPVFLKGLFSVSTTSSRPLPIIRADLIRVLRELDVEYTEIKGGFSCKHTPNADPNSQEQADDVARTGSSAGMNPHKRRISFHGIIGSSKDDPRTPRSPSKPRGSPSATDESDTEVKNEKSSSAIFSKRRSTMGRAPGETTTHVQNDMGDKNTILRFEIFVVKVPLFALHGIQFKKVAGGTWSYKEMAQNVLSRLRL